MEALSEPTNTVWSFPFTLQDWAQTPPAVQVYLHTVHDALGQLQERVDTLEARLKQNSTTSSRPSSSDSPSKRASPAHKRHRLAQSRWETGPSRPLPSALTTCLAHLIRTAGSLAERPNPALAACGTWARDDRDW
jgi:Family of unknown function (DUF6444)